MNISNLAVTFGVQWPNSPTDAVSGASIYMPAANASPADSLIGQLRHQVKTDSQDFKTLKSALSNHDLAAANQAYSQLTQDIQIASRAVGGKSLFDASSVIGKDFQAIGDALNSGDMSGAQNAFASFRQDIKRAGHAARTQDRKS